MQIFVNLSATGQQEPAAPALTTTVHAVGHSLFENFHIFFLTRNHGHWLPLEAQIWLKFWSRTMFHLSRLTNFWGKILQKPVELLFFLIFIK